MRIAGVLVLGLACACGGGAPEPRPTSCAAATAPLGAREDYGLVARVRPTEQGGVAIRSVPAFPGLANHTNLLGVAAIGATFAAQGPLKNPEHGNAVAYAIVVRDAAGETCRGYISAGLVDIERNVRLTDQARVPSAVGDHVTLVGPVRTCRNPTVLGVDVAADPDDCGKVVEVTGLLHAIVVAPAPSTDESIGARGPGTYHQVRDPDGTLSHARVVSR